MSNFGKSLSRELGKNTGKYISNKVFGKTGWATPKRHILDLEEKKRESDRRKQEREERKAERLEEADRRREIAEERRRAREIERENKKEEVQEKKRLREIAKQEKEEQKQHKAWLKEQERIEKEEEKQANIDEVNEFQNYIESIQSVHEYAIEPCNWNDFVSDKSFSSIYSECLVKKGDEITQIKSELKDICPIDQNVLLTYLQNAQDGMNNEGQSLSDDNYVVASQRPHFADEKILTQLQNEIKQTEQVKALTQEKIYPKLEEYPYKVKSPDNDEDVSLIEIRDYSYLFNYFTKEVEKYKGNLKFFTEKLNTHQNELNKVKSSIENLRKKNVVTALLSGSKSKLLEEENALSKLESQILELESRTIPKFKKYITIDEALIPIIEPLAILSDKKDQIELSIKRLKTIFKLFDKHWAKSLIKYESVQEQNGLVQSILNKAAESYPKAHDFMEILGFLDDFGSTVSFNYFSDIIIVDYYVNIDDIVPENKKTVTQSGILNSKPFASSERHTIIQNYICSCIIRIAQETLALFPVSEVVINAIDNRRSTKTGKFEEITILSTSIPQSKLEAINLDYIIPSEAITNFEHNISFSKTNGLGEVAQLSIPNSKKIKFVVQDSGEPTSSASKKGTSPDSPSDDSLVEHSTSLMVSAKMKVGELTEKFKALFNTDIVVHTKKGRDAGLSRRLKALTDIDFQEITLTKANFRDISKLTGLKISLENSKSKSKSTQNKQIKPQSQENTIGHKLIFDKSMLVKDVQDMFLQVFNKKVVVLTSKGNAAGENRRIQALTKEKIDREEIILEKLTKKSLKEVKRRIGLSIDY